MQTVLMSVFAGSITRDGSWAEQTDQCGKNRCRKRTARLYMGHDDRQYRMRYHSVPGMSRLLRTVDAASALPFPARCDSGQPRATKQLYLHRKAS